MRGGGQEKPEGPSPGIPGTWDFRLPSAQSPTSSPPCRERPGKGRGNREKLPGLARATPSTPPRPFFLPDPKLKSPALGLSLLRSPRRGGGATASGGPRCAQMLAAVKSTKGPSRVRPSGFAGAPALPPVHPRVDPAGERRGAAGRAAAGGA